jgi:hypothetical protein
MKLEILVSGRIDFVLIPAYFVILSSIDLSSSMKVGSVTLDRSAPGRSCEMMCERTVCESVSRLVSEEGEVEPLPWSGSTTVVSSSALATSVRCSSAEDLTGPVN